MAINHPGVDIDFEPKGPAVKVPLRIKRLASIPAGALLFLKLTVGGNPLPQPVLVPETGGVIQPVTIDTHIGDDVVAEVGYAGSSTSPITWVPNASQKFKINPPPTTATITQATSSVVPQTAASIPAAPGAASVQAQAPDAVQNPQSQASLFQNPNYSAPTPQSLAAAVRQPLLSVIAAIRNPENIGSLDAAWDLVQQSLIDFAEQNSLPSHARDFSSAVGTEFVFLLQHDPNVPNTVKRAITADGRGIQSLDDLRKKLEIGRNDFRRNVLTHLKADGTARSLLGINATGRPQLNNPFANPKYNEIFNTTCSRFDFGSLSTHIGTMIRGVAEMPPHNDALAQERSRLSKAVMSRLTPEQEEGIKKWGSRCVDFGVQAFGYAALLSGGYGIGLAALAGVPALKAIAGVTTQDIQVAVQERKPWQLLKLLLTNNVVARRFTGQARIGEDLARAGKAAIKGAIPFVPLAGEEGTLAYTTDQNKAQELILQACKKAA